MKGEWSCCPEDHGGERRAPVGACSVLLLTAGVEDRRSRSQSRGGEPVL